MMQITAGKTVFENVKLKEFGSLAIARYSCGNLFIKEKRYFEGIRIGLLTMISSQQGKIFS